MKKHKISPLTLGTVQLGMNYGIANSQGKPDKSVSYEILAKAAELGVTTWDTSRHYGDSEEVIGGFLKQQNNLSPYLISKFKWSEEALQNQKLALEEALGHVKHSLQALGRNQLSLLLYHTDKDQHIESVMQVLPIVLRRLREEGLIEKGGISLYHPQDAVHVVEDTEVMSIQLPMNVFDHRILHNNIMQRLIDAEKTVFARSIFLQGLFFLSEAHIPNSIKAANHHIQQLQELAEMAEMSVAEFAFSFIRDIKGVSSIVFGADNAQQVVQNVQLLAGKAIPEDIREKAQQLFHNVDHKIITPGLWNS